eukprot:scaffold2240_cov172-Ochromonas_danica.AAC.11
MKPIYAFFRRENEPVYSVGKFEHLGFYEVEVYHLPSSASSSSSFATDALTMDLLSTPYKEAYGTRTALQSFMRRWDGASTHCYKRYTTICQSSGYGKTRTIFELKDDIPTIYFCLRRDGQSGIPPRNEAANMLLQFGDLADKFNNPDAVYDCFFDLVIGKIAEMFYEREFNNNREFYQKVFQDTSTKQSTSSFWPSIGETLKTLCDWQLKKPDTTKSNFKFRRQYLLPLELDIILFVFDEAREMLNIKHNIDVQANESKRSKGKAEERTMFKCVRSYFDVQFKPFAIFMDTSSRISNFHPHLVNDTSRRRTEGPSSRLLPCFHWIPSIGLLTLPTNFNNENMWLQVSPPPPQEMTVTESQIRSKTKKAEESTNEIVLRVNVFFLAHLSRAMFASMLYSYRKDVNLRVDLWPNVMQLAKKKLFPAGHNGNIQLRNKQICMAVRFTLLPALHSSARETLVESHMATLLQQDNTEGVAVSTSGVDISANEEDRSMLDIAYVAEPVLGVAACSQMISSGLPLRDYLDSLVLKRKAAELGVLYPQGDVGEFAAAVVLSQCFDLVVKQHFQPQQQYHEDQQHREEQQQRDKSISFRLLFRFAALPISAVDYFAKLLGEIHNPDQLRQKYPLLNNYFMGFTQFIKTDRPISQALLLNALHRRVAFLCRQHEAAIDIVIPMVRCDGDMALMLPSAFEEESGEESCPFTSSKTVKEEDMTAIVCQVKNYHGTTTISPTSRNAMFTAMEETAENIVGTTTKHLSISILFNVGDSCTNEDRRKDTTLLESNNAEIMRIYIPTLLQKFLPFLEEADVDVLQELVSPMTKKYCDVVKTTCACDADSAWKIYNNTIPLTLSLPPGIKEGNEQEEEEEEEEEDKTERLSQKKRTKPSSNSSCK